MYIKPYYLKKVYLHTEVISDKIQMFFPWRCIGIPPLIHDGKNNPQTRLYVTCSQKSLMRVYMRTRAGFYCFT